MESEVEGASLVMVTEQYPRIGGCQRDKTLFYMGSTNGLCPFCAQAPNFVANLPVATEPFAPVDWNGSADPTAPHEGAGAVEGMTSDHNPDDTTAPDAPVDLPTQCPACSAHLRAVITDTDFQLVLGAPTPSEEAPAAEDAPLPDAGESPSVEGAAAPGTEPFAAGEQAGAETAVPSSDEEEAPIV
jgi:hypothetical protein